MGINIEDLKYLFKGYIINNIKKIFGIRLYTDQQEKLFNNAIIGDKIFCMMPVKPIKYIKIRKGHRNRPYIIIDKDEDYLYGYSCTTHPNKRLTRCGKCKVETYYDGELKTSYVIPSEIYQLSKEHIIAKQKHLDNDILANINRCIYMLRKRKKDGSKLLLFDVETKYLKGDVISIDGQYQYIYSIYGNDIYTHNIFFKNDNATTLNIDSQFKAIDFNNKNKYVDLDIDYLYDSMSYEEIKIIDEAKKKHKYKHKHKNNELPKLKYNLKYECGSIMQYPWDEDELYVYIFSINNSNYLISLDNCELGQFKMVNINLTYFEVVDKLTKDSLLDLLNELLNNNKEYQNILENIIEKIKKVQ